MKAFIYDSCRNGEVNNVIRTQTSFVLFIRVYNIFIDLRSIYKVKYTRLCGYKKTTISLHFTVNYNSIYDLIVELINTPVHIFTTLAVTMLLLDCKNPILFWC